MQKAKDRTHNGSVKEKAAEYYIENRDDLKENTKTKYRNLSEKEKQVKWEYGKNRYRNMKGDLKKQSGRVPKKLLRRKKIKYNFFVYYKKDIKMW